MAYISTYDERYYGSFISKNAGLYDAPYSLSTQFVLAEGYSKIAYGATIPILGVADKDTYSLGNLIPGIYTVKASNYTWDYFSNGYWFSSPSVEVANSLGTTIANGYFGTSSFTVYTTGTYYVTVVGSGYESSQYSLYYTYDGSIPTVSNSAATGNLSITGTLNVGSVISASGSYADANGIVGVTPTIQWFSKATNSNSWSIIAGATSVNYVLSSNELGKNIGFAISFTDNAGYSEILSAVGATVVSANQTNSAPIGVVLISGTPTQGQTLTVSNTLSDVDGIGLIRYQWKADDQNISGATFSTFVISQSQVGKNIAVEASYTDGNGKFESVISTATSAVVNVNDAPTGNVLISGTAVQGQTLTVTNSLNDADGMGEILYQWRADGIKISGARNSSLTIGQAQVGKVIKVDAIYTDGFGMVETVSSSSTGAVINLNDAPTGSVTISGLVIQGEVLSVVNSLGDADGLGTITYQWKADGVNISGATNSTLTLGQAQVGKAITVVASYTDSGSTAESISSSATGPVANVNDAPTGAVTISGTARQGQTLTAANTLADADGLGTITYQWKADGVNITGATNSTLTLGQAQVGKAITVVASYTDLGGTAESIQSNATSTISAITSADIVSPVLKSLVIPASIDLSTTNPELIIKAEATDDNSGVKNVVVYFDKTFTYAAITPSNIYNYSFIGMYGVEDDWSDNKSTQKFWIPSANGAGTLKVSSVVVTDIQGNTKTYTASELVSLGVNTSVSLTGGNADTTPPVLTSLVIPASVDLSTTNPELIIKAEATDDNSGVKNVVVYFDKTFTYAAITPSNIYNYSFIGMYGVEDGWSDNKSTQKFWIPSANGAGTLKVSSVVVADIQGNTKTYTASELASLGVNTSVTLLESNTPSKVNAPPSGGVIINGTVTQGQILIASNTLSDADGLGTIKYQWKADGVNISGATSSTLLLGQTQVGKTITVVASYTDSGNTAESIASIATGPVANLNDAPTGSVTISGTAKQGQILTVTNTLADADGLGTITYQWKADGVNLSGASGANLTLAQAQVGKVISVTASYTDLGNSAESITSSATTAVINSNFAPTGAVTIGGTAKQGQTLTATNTLADADGLGTISYQWKAEGVNISGATGTSLTLNQAQVGKAITAVASYTDGGGTAESVISSPSTPVTGLPVGSTLTGQIYHWKSHTLLAGAEVSLAGLTSSVASNSTKPLYELKNIDYSSATGEVKVGLWMNLTSSIKNFDLNLKNAEGQALGFTADTSIFPSGWAIQTNPDATGGLSVAGFGDVAFTGTSVQLGTITFKSNGATQNVQLNFVDGSVGGVTAVQQQTLTPYAASIHQELSVTGADGKYSISALDAGTYSLDVSKSLTSLETGSAISSADALAALKIAVGRNPNIDGTTISPYQLIAADVNQDGKVTSADALAILKMAVKRTDAPLREWLFVSESQDFWDEAANNGQGGLTISRTNVTWNKDLQATVSQDTTANILAVLKGDVNGSWTGAATGTQSLPNSYFSDLVKKGLGPLSTWGVVAA